jgi:hypothetical protein
MPKMLKKDGNIERKNLEGEYESKEDDNPENVLGWSESLLKLCLTSHQCCISNQSSASPWIKTLDLP